MAHHDRYIRECAIVLVEEGRLNASTAGELCGATKFTARAWLQEYWKAGQVGRRRGTDLWHVSNPAQDAAFLAEAQ
jgi:hypothetical protein